MTVNKEDLEVGMLVLIVIPYEGVPVLRTGPNYPNVLITPSETHIGVIRGFQYFTEPSPGNKRVIDINSVRLIPDDAVESRVILDRYLGNPRALVARFETVAHIYHNTMSLFKLIYF